MIKPESVQAPSFAALAQAFFAEHLQQQRAMSPRTVAAYRDAFVLFLDFAQARLRKQPTAIRLDEITPALILAFLDHLEHERGNTVRSRNARLAALRAFLKFAGPRTSSATRRRCISCRPASTSASSPCGSGTRARRQPTNTSKLIWR